MNTSRLRFFYLTTLLCFSVHAACGDSDAGADAGTDDASSMDAAGATGTASAADLDSGETADAGTASAASTAGGSDADGSSGPVPETTGETAMLVDLGSAGDFLILAKSGISTVPPSMLVGDLGISPADGTYLTGFSLTADASGEFSTSAQVTGQIYAANDAPPTPTEMTTAIGDMELAFDDAAGRPADVTELGAGAIGGMTLEPATYAWGTGLSIATDVTLDGSATDVWIFQVAGDLVMESGTSVILSGGAVPEHVYWQVAGLVDLGTTAHLDGVVLTRTAITLRTGASVNGRLLAQTAVDIDQSTIVQPAGS
jgi:hypothetical protein